MRSASVAMLQSSLIDTSLTGHVLLWSALGLSILSVGSGLLAVKQRGLRLAQMAKRGLVATTVLIVAANLLLLAALISRDFSLFYVASYTSRSTPRVYAFSALWAGMEGSLLFWTLTTSIFAAAAVATRKISSPLIPGATAILSAILAFFLGLLVFGADPFAIASPIPQDGSGLNPLLQSPFMTIHPVMLYLGLTGFAVPFSFAISSLIAGRQDVHWFTSTRRWTILAWSFLTVGILLGSAWAYSELGWGGYWAWDPVENASLLPWLTGTAFLHSMMIQERRGMLKVWNVGLIIGTYSLTIFGTFLTRSGLLSSVHTFSESPVGKYFLPMLGLILVGSFAMLGWRLDRLRSERQLESMLSREAMFLFNNLLFIGIAFTVLWGTLYPILVEAIEKTRISVGPPFFNAVVTPIGLALLGLTGIGPMVAWRKPSVTSLRRQLAIPLIAGTATVLALAAAGVRSAGALFAMSLCSFVAVATIAEFAQGAKAHRGPGPFGYFAGLRRVVGRNRRRYGGYVVHLGVVLIFLGLSGSAFKQTWTGQLRPGESFEIGTFKVEYVSSSVRATDEKMINMAIMQVRENGKVVKTLRPQRNFHLQQRQPQSEIGLMSTLSRDLYLVLTNMDRERSVTMKAWINPLVAWIWLGGVVMTFGMIVIISGRPPRPQTLRPQGSMKSRAQRKPKEQVTV